MLTEVTTLLVNCIWLHCNGCTAIYSKQLGLQQLAYSLWPASLPQGDSFGCLVDYDEFSRPKKVSEFDEKLKTHNHTQKLHARTQRGASCEVPRWSSTWQTLFRKTYCSLSTPAELACLGRERRAVRDIKERTLEENIAVTELGLVTCSCTFHSWTQITVGN